MTFRKSIFWLHLAAGLVAGLVIAIMSFTGAALAFEKEIIARVEHDALRVVPPAPGAVRLPLNELVRRVRAAQPAARPASITVSSDRTMAVQVSLGREAGTCYVDPYSGAVRAQGAQKWRAFFHAMEDWHRWLGRHGEQRPIGKAITGACNAAFLFLAVSGLFLWWPRKWRTKGLKRSLWFLRDATGRARDWNWHNVIGFWSAPILMVLTATGVVMSYRWANDLVYHVTGSPLPAPGPGGPAPGSSLPADANPKEPGVRPLDYDVLVAAAQSQSTRWDTLTLRLAGGARGNAGSPRPANETRGNETRGRENRGVPAPVVIIVKEHGAWPRFASTTLTLDPYTGESLKRESFADGTPGRRLRSWIRFLHTGEALGPMGQAIAALASLAACFLVYTGFALAWRRFFGPKEKPAAVP